MKKNVFLIIMLLSAIIAQAQNSPDKILGIWMSEEKDAKIEIVKDRGKYFGKLVWFENRYNVDNISLVLDENNPDKSKRNRPLMNCVILKGFVFSADKNVWQKGMIYNPDDGNSYKSIIKLENDNVMKLRGYVGFSLLGKTTTWTRCN